MDCIFITILDLQHSDPFNILLQARTRVMLFLPLDREKNYEHFDTKHSFFSKLELRHSGIRATIDEKNVKRCGGRISNAPLDVNSRFPFLLPKKITD
jgi:hypothetical protein